MKHFSKELFSTPLRLPNGRTLLFTEVADDTGIIATEDGYIIRELTNLIKRRVGGVTEIDEAAYEELKKNPPSRRSSDNWFNAQSINQLSRSAAARSAEQMRTAATPAPRQSAPMVVPQTIPVTTKLTRKPAATPTTTPEAKP